MRKEQTSGRRGLAERVCLPMVWSDHVFEESVGNDEVFDELVKDIVHSAVLGFNGTS